MPAGEPTEHPCGPRRARSEHDPIDGTVAPHHALLRSPLGEGRGRHRERNGRSQCHEQRQERLRPRGGASHGRVESDIAEAEGSGEFARRVGRCESCVVRRAPEATGGPQGRTVGHDVLRERRGGPRAPVTHTGRRVRGVRLRRAQLVQRPAAVSARGALLVLSRPLRRLRGGVPPGWLRRARRAHQGPAVLPLQRHAYASVPKTLRSLDLLRLLEGAHRSPVSLSVADEGGAGLAEGCAYEWEHWLSSLSDYASSGSSSYTFSLSWPSQRCVSLSSPSWLRTIVVSSVIASIARGNRCSGFPARLRQ